MLAQSHLGERPPSPGWRLGLVAHVVRFRAACYLLAALAALEVVVRLQAPRWRAHDPVFYRERLAACRRGRWDLVVVGGSPVMSGIDVGVLDGLRWQGRALAKSFNLGLPLATTAEVWHAVEHGLARPPRLLVYGIAATDLNGSRREPNGPRHLMTAGDVVRWAHTRPDQVGWGLWNHVAERVASLWALSYYRGGIRLWAADRIGARWPGLCPEAVAEARLNLARTALLDSPRGFAPPAPAPASLRLDWIKASGQPVPRFPFLDGYQVGPYLPYLDRLLDWGQRQGVQVVLVNMPVTADLEARFPEVFTTYRAALTEAAGTHGVRVLWPTRAEVGLTDAHFSDLIHLNADGMTRFSAWLRGALERL